MTKLAYLVVDIFCHLNNLDISLQGFCTNIFKLINKTDAFKQKLALWDGFVQKGDTDMFSILNVTLTSVDVISKELLYYRKLTFVGGTVVTSPVVLR